MGRYLNPSPKGFWESLNSAIYVDKSGLIARINPLINTFEKYVCLSRPRRFGKSSALNMLSAYYSYGQDSHALFDDLQIHGDASYEQHINQYDVLKVNMQDFLSTAGDIGTMLQRVRRFISMELRQQYPDVFYFDVDDFVQVLGDVYTHTQRPFVILIDEWDCIFREYREEKAAQTKYLDFLRLWLKDKDYVALAYMTGILPIKKYGTHSALNMFTEYSMTGPRDLAPYFGFTESEVRSLCGEYGMDFNEAKSWYDGYELIEQDWWNRTVHSMYNPKSIVESMKAHHYDTYWNQTETYEALQVYIRLNMDGLKDAVVKMLSGEVVTVDTSGFVNDMTTFSSAHDVLTLLIHLGYLSYHRDSNTVTIPNKEVTQVYVTSISRIPGWNEVARSVEASRMLLESLWKGDGAAVAEGIDRAHNEISILKYNDENSLSCTINLAFYFAKEYYNIVREMPAGKGFADICFVPRPLHMDKPAAIIELKYDKSAEGAIGQIKRKQYVAALGDYRGHLLLAGINYDRETKTHSCIIEQTEL